jgi:hypothetical protein
VSEAELMVAIIGAGCRDEALWAVLSNRILADAARRKGRLNGALIADAANRLNRSPRTVRRWLGADPTGRVPYQFRDLDLGYVSRNGGSVHAAWREMGDLGLTRIGYRAFLRGFNRLDPGVRTGVRFGSAANSNYLPWLTLAAPTHANEIFEIDHTLLGELLVRGAGTNKTGHAWLTIVIDVHSRAVVGFAVTLADGGAANTESAFAAIADTVLGRDYDGTFVGGMPTYWRFDQGSDFMGHVADAIDRLGGRTQPAPANTPQAKPYVERAIGTVKHQIVPRLPGFGLRMDASNTGRRQPASLLTLPELANLLDAEFRNWNLRVHRGHGHKPIDVYRDSQMKPEFVPESAIALALLRRNRTARVQKGGVMFNTILYQGEATFGLIGQTVSVGYLETHPEFIYLFDSRGRFLGKLEPAASAGLALAAAVRDRRTRQIETVRRAEALAEKLAASGLIQLRGDQPGGELAVAGGKTPTRRSKSIDRAMRERRRARVAATGIWKAPT